MDTAARNVRVGITTDELDRIVHEVKILNKNNLTYNIIVIPFWENNLFPDPVIWSLEYKAKIGFQDPKKKIKALQAFYSFAESLSSKWDV